MADSSMLRILQLILVYNRVYQLPKKKSNIYIFIKKCTPITFNLYVLCSKICRNFSIFIFLILHEFHLCLITYYLDLLKCRLCLYCPLLTKRSSYSKP